MSACRVLSCRHVDPAAGSSVGCGTAIAATPPVCWREARQGSGAAATAPVRESVLHWKPTSARQLEASEAEILAAAPAGISIEQAQIPVTGGWVHTLRLRPTEHAGRLPLVAMHGFAGGSALWVRNMPAFAASGRDVYLIDVPGFARSARLPYSGSTPEAAEEYFLRPLDEWFRNVGVSGSVVLMGHSMGGFLAASYSLSRPDRVASLVLVDPFGTTRRPDDHDQQMADRGWKFRLINYLAGCNIRPLGVLRAAGPWGPGLLPRVRADMVHKWGSVHQREGAVTDYIWHCNSQDPAAGETAFMDMQVPIAYAARPLCDRIQALADSVQVSFIYGIDTWMSQEMARRMAAERKGTSFDCIPGARHHPYADNPDAFNAVLLARLAAMP
eukprot:TRINITY_DN70682_c0_g1_i1.p2 TRINITY_DN70682_c0_g1~~TRINITY_DN70682_c0_g1_i1.p2  ORF type:complete len:415 (+),score=109.28 TRINITY_DN70682_c0_g1_i1:90-1247(+)